MKVYSQKSTPAITEQYFQFDPSFGPYIRFLIGRLQSTVDVRSKFYRYLIKKFQQQPHLLKPFKNVKVLEQNDDLVQLLSMSLLPLSTDTEHVPMALAFMQPSCLFYYTTSFKEMFIDNPVEFNTKEDEISNLRYFVKLILEKCYGVKVYDFHKMIKAVKNKKGGSVMHYQLNIESRFLDVHVKDGLPGYEDEWYKLCNAEYSDFLALFKNFPSDKFCLEGFCMFSIQDVTKEVALNHLKNALLNMHLSDIEETLGIVEGAIGELLNDAKVRISITPFLKINGRIVYDRSFKTKGVGVSTIEKRLKKGATIQDIYINLEESPRPYVFSSFDKEFVTSRASIGEIVNHEVKNFMVYPITNKRDGLLGVFELEKGNITSKTIDILQPAVPLIADLLYFMIEMFDNKITRLVKEKFTPLQQSVEWKFIEVAWQHLRNDITKKETETIADVEFEQVYPLYGAIDIRDSSIERNLALRSDFKNQLTATLQLLDATSVDISLPLLDSIKYKCATFLELVTTELTNEDELKIEEFFKNEVVVFLTYLNKRFPKFSQQINNYVEKMNGKKGEFNLNETAYETTVTLINKTIISYLDDEVTKQQSIYPFYFEKFRTDGVEYDIYIGQSIVPDKLFDRIYLKNLRLWQLTSMANIAKSTMQMQAELPIKLQTTQLILLHNLPIDICFRKDERRFDVEGSENIRYEMLKKRIDKVRLKTSMERLTQPDKIAIIYSNALEAEEYVEHIQFLQSKGILETTIEYLELESLQGVTGLKALRVGINYDL